MGFPTALLTSLRWTETPSNAMLQTFVAHLFPPTLSSAGTRIISRCPTTVSLNQNCGCSGSAHRVKSNLICFMAMQLSFSTS